MWDGWGLLRSKHVFCQLGHAPKIRRIIDGYVINSTLHWAKEVVV